MGHIPKFAKNLKPNIKQGVSEAVRRILTNRNVSTEFVRMDAIGRIADHVFGNAWATKHPIEKKILDKIIHMVSITDGDVSHLHSWFLSKEEIMKNAGIKLVHKNNFISEFEIKLIEGDFKTAIEVVDNFKGPQDTSDHFGHADIDNLIKYSRDYVNYVHHCQKVMKEYKSLCKQIVDERSSFIFTTPANNKLKKAKKPINELIANIKDTHDYVKLFSPSRLCSKNYVMIYYQPRPVAEMNLMTAEVQLWFKNNALNSQRAQLGYSWICEALASVTN